MSLIPGEYSFVSQNGFEEYLKKKGVGMMARKMVSKTTPTIKIKVIEGNKYEIETITSIKTVTFEFTLDTPYQQNSVNPQGKKHITSLDGNTLITKLAENGEVVTCRGADMHR